MLAALIIATAATALLVAVMVFLIVTGWFPRLSALLVRGIESVLRPSDTRRLNRRDRSELVARLWVP
jgi:hypothetical protein